MDVISLSKALKAKKAIKVLNDRLGSGVQDIHPSVKVRLEKLEEKDPHVTSLNRISEVEAVTVANINKHNLRMNTVLNKNRFRMSELAFDDFGDATGIDATKSSGHQYDATGKKVIIAGGQTLATVVTTAELLTADPTMIVVSQATNTKTTDTKAANLAGGVKTNADLIDGKLQLHVAGSIGSGYGPDVTPTMTSNTAPAPYVASSADGVAGAHAVFNKQTSTGKYGRTNSQSTWIQLDYGVGSAKKIVKYQITAAYNEVANANPGTWKFEGSNDASNWTALDSQSGVTWATNTDIKSFSFSNTTGYRYYRINITANSGYSGTITMIGQVNMYESAQLPLYSPSGSYESPVLDLGSNYKSFVKLDQIANAPYIPGSNNSIPVMTSGSTPAPYSVDRSSYQGSYDPYKAFNGSIDAGWMTASGTITGWISFDFGSGSGKSIVKYTVTAPNATPTRSPKNWTFEGSNDALTWVVLDTQSNQTGWVASEKRSFSAFVNTKSYRYYRLNVSANNGDASYLAIGEIEMMEKDLLSSSSLSISTSTSTDGITFSPYAPLNADGTIASPSGRYIKLKSDMIAGSVIQASTPNDFVAAESTQFQSDTQIIFDGSLKLKTAYSDPMVADTSYAEAGVLLRKTINKAFYKAIEKVGVS